MHTMHIRKLISTFAGDTRGTAAVMLAGGMLAFVGMASLAVDMGHLYMTQNRLQATADAAAVAATDRLPAVNEARNQALAFVEMNMPSSTDGTVLAATDFKTGNWNATTRTFTDGGIPLNAVQVTARRAQANGNTMNLFFGPVLGRSTGDLAATAVATRYQAPCILALDTSSDALIINSNSDITANDCTVHSNGGIDSNSASSVTADMICASGTATGSGYSPSPTEGCPEEDDPYEYLTPPAAPGSCITDKVVETIETLSPGRYCGKLEVNAGGEAHLQPGIYYMDNAELIANSDSAIYGDDVMIFLTGTSGRLKVNSDSHVELSADTVGPYPGIIIYQDQNATPLVEQLINSDSGSILNGIVYLPQSHLKSNSFGTMIGSTGMQVVARRIEVNSDSSITADQYIDGGSPRREARLVQ